MGACCSKPLDPTTPQQHYLPQNPPMIYAQNHPLAPNRTLAPASVYQPNSNSNTYSPHVPMYVPPPSPPPISIPTRMFPQDPVEPQRRNMTQVVLGIDFGTTESGFAYCRRPSPGEAINVAEMITTNHQWPHVQGKLKTNTALEYDANWIVVKWGYPALAQRNAVKPKAGQPIQRPVELFKLHLGDMKDEDKPYLPPGLHYKQAITDYLREFGRLAMNTLNRTWPHLNFHEHVQIVMTVPAEFNDNTKAILRSCAHGAGLINTEDSENLAFTTEPEAAAIYCLNMVNQYPIQEQEPFMIVDCGGGTVDLTTRTLLPEGKLSEITVRSGEFCGSTYVDRQFLMWLSRQLGIATMKTISQNHYASLQYVVQEFFVRKVKVPFTGDPTEFVPIFLDIEDEFPAAMQYVTPKLRPILEAQQWRIQLDFDTVKKMFDPVVSGIISLIEAQLEASAPQQCQAIFLVGGFSESPYLYNCVREKFASQVPTICVAQQPIAAVVRGAVLYGLNQETITTRMLKWTYGIECYREWNPNIDEQSRRTHDGRCKYFDLLAKRGTQVGVNQQFTGVYCTSYAHQTKVGFPVYVTTEDYATYCDGLRLLGQLEIDVPVDPHNYGKREIEFSLMFGQMEIKAAARILRTGFVCHTMLKFEQ